MSGDFVIIADVNAKIGRLFLNESNLTGYFVFIIVVQKIKAAANSLFKPPLPSRQ